MFEDQWFEQFKAYRKEVWPEVQVVDKLLAIKLSDEPSTMSNQVDTVETLFHRFTFILADADEILSNIKKEKIPQILDALKTLNLKINEYNKKIFLESACSEVQKFRDKIKGTIDSIAKRITLGQSKMKSEREYRNVSHN